MSKNKVFFHWNRPVLDHAVSYLTQDWKNGLLDLSDHLIIVPTRHASRRLRERLAQTAALQNSAVLPGRITTPEILFRPPEDETPVVDSITTSLVWQQVIRDLCADDMCHLFPDGALPKEFSTRHALAQELIQLRSLLCEEGYTIRSFSERYTDNPEALRWQNLGLLEEYYLTELKTRGLRDDCTEKIKASLNPVAHQGYKRISVLFTPDPPALAITALELIAKQTEITIGIHAPEEEAKHFDAWGRPLPSYWPNALIPVHDRQIHLSSTAQNQMSEICTALASLPEENRTSMVIGVPDSSITPFLESQLHDQGIQTFDPSGKQVAGTPLCGLIEAFGRLFVEPMYDAFTDLVRHPFMLTFFLQRIKDFKTSNFLSELDIFQNKHLPTDYAVIHSFLKPDSLLAAVVSEVDRLLDILNQNSPASSLQPLLAEIFTGRKLRATNRADQLFAETANILATTLESINKTPMIEQLSASECMQIIAQEFRQQRITGDHGQHAIDLLGWLELSWEDASHLILTGMADGNVPETIVGHIFLPDQARCEMNLRDNVRRLARDAYLFKAMIMSRQTDGEVHIYCSKTTVGGDPQKPSRLLLMGEPENLARRALLLFREIPDQTTCQHRQADWLLKPMSPRKPSKHPKHISITALRDYLDCPFGYYLKRMCQMRHADDNKLELDPQDFGNLCHQVLHLFGESKHADSTDEKEIASFLNDTAEQLFSQQYGKCLSLPLIIQLNTVHERLKQVARVQAAIRKEGWHIENTEVKYSLEINGWQLEGRIDRIDRNEKGLIRLIDYKTSNKADPPHKIHLRNLQPEAYRQASDKKSWKDLQLPLYQLLFSQTHGTDPALIQCAYFVMPKIAKETGILLWEDLSQDLIDSAKKCTEEILRRIDTQQFWPPQNIDKNQDFAFLFYDTAEETMDTNAMQSPNSPIKMKEKGGVSCK